jgi:hypothetical protein
MFVNTCEITVCSSICKRLFRGPSAWSPVGPATGVRARFASDGEEESADDDVRLRRGVASS